MPEDHTEGMELVLTARIIHVPQLGSLVCHCEGALPAHVDSADVAGCLRALADQVEQQERSTVPMHRSN